MHNFSISYFSLQSDFVVPPSFERHYPHPQAAEEKSLLIGLPWPSGEASILLAAWASVAMTVPFCPG